MERDAVVRAIVRGERPWTDLRSLGIEFEVGLSSIRILEGLTPPVHVDAKDVAAGLLAHSHDSDSLRDWARVVHGSIGLIELDLEDHPEGDNLLDALWRISFGEPFTTRMRASATRALA